MFAGYMRVSKADGSQTTDLQRDALLRAGVSPNAIFEDWASGKNEDRPQLIACLKSLNAGDTLLVWNIDRLGRTLRHLVNTVHELMEKGVGFIVLNSAVDTTTANGRLMFGLLALVAEYERELLIARTKAGLMAARERGRIGGRPRKLTSANVQLTRDLILSGKSKVSELCKLFNVSRQTIYRCLTPANAMIAIDPNLSGTQLALL